MANTTMPKYITVSSQATAVFHIKISGSQALQGSHRQSSPLISSRMVSPPSVENSQSNLDIFWNYGQDALLYGEWLKVGSTLSLGSSGATEMAPCLDFNPNI